MNDEPKELDLNGKGCIEEKTTNFGFVYDVGDITMILFPKFSHVKGCHVLI